MAAETLQHAFEAVLHGKIRGQTGLGLSMAAGFIKQSGGAVRINGEIGRGTSVTIYLPISLARLARFGLPRLSVGMPRKAQPAPEARECGAPRDQDGRALG
jgi:hypothetical protein